jgi:formate C-acetyltransferase
MQRAAKVSKKEKNEKDDCWREFKPGSWCNTIDVRSFITSNVAPYTGDESFLKGPTRRTMAVWEKLQPYFREERNKGVLAVDAQTPSTLLAHKAGYIDRANEVIVGLQTDQPFKRAIFPFGGLRMVEAGLKAAGFAPDPAVHEAFTKYRKSHNDGVFDRYYGANATRHLTGSAPRFRQGDDDAQSRDTIQASPAHPDSASR